MNRPTITKETLKKLRAELFAKQEAEQQAHLSEQASKRDYSNTQENANAFTNEEELADENSM